MHLSRCFGALACSSAIISPIVAYTQNKENTCIEINNCEKNHKDYKTSICHSNINEKMTKMTNSYRSVKRIMERPYRHWVGDAFHVYPVFADLAFTEDISPLLMFDYAAPEKFKPKKNASRPRGVGQHPHRGFETVTIAFQGEVEHNDNKGGSGVIGPGDVQWMTAAKGIVHEEYHSKKFTQEGGIFEMCQLWVNLPKKYKMAKPRYQPILNKEIPEVILPLDRVGEDDSIVGKVRLIAGELDDIKGKAKTFSPVQMWDVSLPHAGSEVDIPYPADQNCIVFVRRGGIQVLSGDNDTAKNSSLGPQDVAVMHLDGSDVLRIRVEHPDTSLLIMGGEPLNEPIAARGPFVMNTQNELRQAMIDYQMGKF